jgi:dCTP deaminase
MLWSKGVFPARYIERLAARVASLPALRSPTRCSRRASTCGWAMSPIASRQLPARAGSHGGRAHRNAAAARLDLTDGAVLERGCVYLVPLQESLACRRTSARAPIRRVRPAGSTSSPASSATAARGFDTLPPATRGRSISRSARAPSRSACAGLAAVARCASASATPGSTRASIARCTTSRRWSSTPMPRSRGRRARSPSTSRARGATGLIGFRSKRHTPVIDMDKKDALDVLDYWEPLVNRGEDQFILDPDEFYILVAAKRACAAGLCRRDGAVRSAGGRVPRALCRLLRSRLRPSAAGGTGSRAVLEVRSREVPFLLGHGQTIGRLVYERLSELPDALYGTGSARTTRRRRLKLSKHFSISSWGRLDWPDQLDWRSPRR